MECDHAWMYDLRSSACWMLCAVPNAWQENEVFGIGILIFFCCMILMSAASTFYHAMLPETKGKQIFHVLDHICIYLAIAGSYTPAVLCVMQGFWQIALLLFQWGMVVIGIFYKIFAEKRIHACRCYYIWAWDGAFFFCCPNYCRKFLLHFWCWLLQEGLLTV